jgi:hypothetical protein
MTPKEERYLIKRINKPNVISALVEFIMCWRDKISPKQPHIEVYLYKLWWVP